MGNAAQEVYVRGPYVPDGGWLYGACLANLCGVTCVAILVVKRPGLESMSDDNGNQQGAQSGLDVIVRGAPLAALEAELFSTQPPRGTEKLIEMWQSDVATALAGIGGPMMGAFLRTAGPGAVDSILHPDGYHVRRSGPAALLHLRGAKTQAECDMLHAAVCAAEEECNLRQPPVAYPLADLLMHATKEEVHLGVVFDTNRWPNSPQQKDHPWESSRFICESNSAIVAIADALLRVPFVGCCDAPKELDAGSSYRARLSGAYAKAANMSLEAQSSGTDTDIRAAPPTLRTFARAAFTLCAPRHLGKMSVQCRTSVAKLFVARDRLFAARALGLQRGSHGEASPETVALAIFRRVCPSEAVVLTVVDSSETILSQRIVNAARDDLLTLDAAQRLLMCSWVTPLVLEDSALSIMDVCGVQRNLLCLADDVRAAFCVGSDAPAATAGDMQRFCGGIQEALASLTAAVSTMELSAATATGQPEPPLSPSLDGGL